MENTASRGSCSVPLETVVGLLELAGSDGGTDDGEIAKLLAELDLPETARAQLDERVRRLRAGSERLRQRGQELSALFSSARELVRLRDVDQLLGRLVERAHDLMGTDVTYLSEFDERTRELRVRTTLGTATPTFRGLGVPPGMGLASLVVERRQPYWTANYAEMDQAPHDPEIDATVAEEGLVSLLGVPLLAGEEVIGVLFAANRFVHSFAPGEVSLLSAFADHAALVLQTARLLAQTKETAEDARKAYGELTRHTEAVERASGVHSELTALVLRGGDTAAVASALGAALRCRVTVLDPGLGVTAVTAGPGDGGSSIPAEASPRRAEIQGVIEESRRSGRCVSLPAPGHGVAVAVLAAQTFLGALVLEQGAVEFGPIERRTAERAAQITALLSLKQDAVIEAEQRVRGDLLADLLSDDPRRRASVTQRARARGIRLAELRCLVVVSLPADHRRLAARAAGCAAGGGGLIGEYADWVVALIGERDPSTAAAQVHAAIGQAVEVSVVAVGTTLPDAERDVREQLHAAVACARVLPMLGVIDTSATTDEYLPYTALFGPGETRVATFVDNLIGPVLDWDAERGGSLVATLAAYLDHRLSPVMTARVLHLHKNTVLQRLERITALLGDDWQEPERLFRIGVAVRVERLATAEGPGK